MRADILPVQVHTIGHLLDRLGMSNAHKGLHVFDTTGNRVELPILYPFRSDHFSFLIVKKGSLLVKMNLLEFTLTANYLLMLSPNVVRQFISVSDDCELISIVFTGECLSRAGIHHKDIDGFEFLSSQVNPLLATDAAEIDVLLKMLNLILLKTEPANDRAYQNDVLIHFFAGFIYEISSLYKKQEAIAEVRGTRKEELTFRFLKLLPQCYKEQRSVQFYAAQLNVTPKYLSQTVKEVTGKTAGDFIEEMVTMEAKIMLNNLELTIGQVAGYLNFSDQFFFSKYFKKVAGLTPSQYRQTA